MKLVMEWPSRAFTTKGSMTQFDPVPPSGGSTACRKGKKRAVDSEVKRGRITDPLHYNCTLNCPAVLILITPPQLHIRILESVSAGNAPIRTVGIPVTHGAMVMGTQGIGVNTPKAAAVAAATRGLAGFEHMPKGIMLTKGLLSMMLAAKRETLTLLVGGTMRVDGAAPKQHCSIAPPVTRNPIDGTL